MVSAVDLPDGDRRVAWALTTGGAPIVAGEHSLVLPGEQPLAWWEVARVTWSRPHMTVVEVAEIEGESRRWELQLAPDDGGLPEVVRARVTASVAWSSSYQLTGGGSVRMVGRRRPDQETLHWQLVFERAQDHQDVGRRVQAQQLLDQARRTIG
ncbi:MAG: hypothetical protein M3N21_04605 [Actinomycetota bacterium]|nr:hypothetical protein [Actinomycetota bacterium]